MISHWGGDWKTALQMKYTHLGEQRCWTNIHVVYAWIDICYLVHKFTLSPSLKLHEKQTKIQTKKLWDHTFANKDLVPWRVLECQRNKLHCLWFHQGLLFPAGTRSWQAEFLHNGFWSVFDPQRNGKIMSGSVAFKERWKAKSNSVVANIARATSWQHILFALLIWWNSLLSIYTTHPYHGES